MKLVAAALVAGLLCAAGGASATTFFETADPAVTVVMPTIANPVEDSSIKVTFTIPTPVTLDSTNSSLSVNVPFASPVFLPLNNIAPLYTYQAVEDHLDFQAYYAVYDYETLPSGEQGVLLSRIVAQYFIFDYSPRPVGNYFVGGIFAVTLNDLPEPAAWVMMLLGLVGVGAALRRRRYKPTSTHSRITASKALAV